MNFLVSFPCPLPPMPSPSEAGVDKADSEKEKSSGRKWYPHTAQRTSDPTGAWKISRRLPTKSS